MFSISGFFLSFVKYHMIELNNLKLRARCFSKLKYHSMINIPGNVNEIGKYLFIIGLIHSFLILPVIHYSKTEKHIAWHSAI
jgi:hypothetical protein